MEDDSFNIKFVRGDIQGIWDFIMEIPLFLNIARVGKKGWDKRLKEELEKIEYLKKLKGEQNQFSNIYQDPDNPRIFHVEGASDKAGSIKFKLRLPMRYPFVPPYAEEFYHGKYSFYSYSDHGRVACLDKINNRWNKEGRHGIAHFLAMLGYYTALARHNVNLRTLARKSRRKPRSRK
jgi:ubiquitin-protein ligase